MKDFTFNGQWPNESVEEIIKNYPYVLFWPGVLSIFFLSVPVAVLIFFGASNLFAVSAFVFILLAFAFFFKAYYEYAASVLLITSERVIYLNQKGFFRRKIVETNLDKIQDVTSDTKGMIRTAMDFGDVTIRTAGASQGTEIIFKNIPHPYEIQQEITKRIK